MPNTPFRSAILLLAGTVFSSLVAAPRPGDVYREFPFAMGGPTAWRVTDPAARHAGAREFLPNPVLKVRIDDLDDAVRAEIEIDHWNGHAGTSGKRLRWNGGAWLDLPQAVSPCYYAESTVVMPIPLSDLRVGHNTLEGTSGPQKCGDFGWGQWGWYGGVVRVYYRGTKPHATASIVAPATGATISDNPLVEFAVRGDVTRIDLLASYDGYDEDGDGIYTGWHAARRGPDLAAHAGSAVASPWRIRWATDWVPDQTPATVELMARVRDRRGYWSVTPVVRGLTLARGDVSVALLRPAQVGEQYGVRAGRTRGSVVVAPDTRTEWTQAAVAMATWNGLGEAFTLNGVRYFPGGANHNYALTMTTVRPELVHAGENRIEFHSETEHHGVEVLWPGPAVLLRRGPTVPTVQTDGWLDPDWDGRIALHTTCGELATVALELPDEADPASLRVVRYSDEAMTQIEDRVVPWQWESGRLTVQAPGQAILAVYFARRPRGVAPIPVSAAVSVTEGERYQGQPGIVVNSGAMRWIYHAEGAGFAALIDRDGKDWIGYREGGKAAGEYRGIPNLGEFAHPGYTGERGSVTRVESRGPLRARLRSVGRTGQGTLLWEFEPGRARLTVEHANAPYWFLYEGTPGGNLDLTDGYWGLSDGRRRPLSEIWNQSSPAPEWAYFGTADGRRVLYLARHAGAPVNGQYWPMDGQMTVFGFGRGYPCCEKYLTAPAVFTVGFAEVARDRPIEFDDIRRSVARHLAPAHAEAGRVEWRERH